MKFIDDKIRVTIETLKSAMYKETLPELRFEYLPCGYKSNNMLPGDSENWKTFSKNSRVSGCDSHYWFRTKFKTPEKNNENEEIYFRLLTGKEGEWDATNPQGLLYLNGQILQGLDINHTDAILEFDTEYDMYIYFYVGMHQNSVDFNGKLKLLDTKIEKLYYHMNVPYEAALCLEKNDDNYIQIIKGLEMACNLIDFREIKSSDFYKSVDNAIVYLEEEFYKKICGRHSAIVNCIGHTHIDVAWLWTLAQTREKVQRSFSTVLSLMKKYPEYKFMSSQPQLYKYLKEEAPELYDEVKKLVSEGRWEVEGAMWVEADCNLASGESLIRQILFGKKFIRDEFGIESKVLWLPDVFGYSAALPQILKKSGVDKFVTSKISWNEYNKLPCDTFMWEGLDGTSIFTQFLTAQTFDKNAEDDTRTTYVGYIRPNQVLGAWKRYQQKQYNNETIITFGYGDGGGGPTKDMLEQQRRLQYGIPGFPATKIDTATNFLNRVEENFNKNSVLLKRMPTWIGELYLELHRGTYTSVAKNKKNNRMSEFLYQTIEELSTIDMELNNGFYPQEKINRGWETILLNQFHDIIPGSSIYEVYENSDKDYERIIEKGMQILNEKIDKIISNINTDGGVFVYNPNSFEVNGMIDVDGAMMYVQNIPPIGWKVIEPVMTESSVMVRKECIESDFYKVTFDEAGNIVSLFDKEYKRHVIVEGEKGNEFQVFEDMPRCYDAWEITNYYKQKMWTIDKVESIEILKENTRSGLRITKKYGKSTIVQKIYLYENVRKIDFETEIDWHEEHVLLKTAFPLNVHAEKATFDIQFGNVERPTHTNTSWETAKFEVCAHKWADISEDDYGVSLINDCKYGYSTERNVLKLTLLKCATYPNPEADKGKHKFTYSLYPHYGNAKRGGTIQQAYLLNRPLIAKRINKNNGVLSDEFSVINCDKENIIIETVKKSENSDDMIIRLFDSYNRKTTTCIKFGFDIKRVYICDMLENEISEVKVVDNSINVDVGNFEILTLKILS